MGDAAEPEPLVDVEHPLWARFLRWCTIHPEEELVDDTYLTRVEHDPSPHLSSLPDYKYTPLDDPDRDARVVELLPGKFDDDVRVRIHQVTLKPPPTRPGDWRKDLEAVRKEMPEGWEAFKTIVDRRYFFRNKKTGKVQWEHPTSRIDPRRTGRYDFPPKDGSFPHYETLSYVWGCSDKTAVIEVDRPEEHGPARLPVTESLITALRYLRYPVKKRNLWIDAICLNQNDKYELNKQVPRMGEIYKLAYTGTAWLGVDSHDSAQAIKTLQYLGTQAVGEGETGLLFCSPDATEGTWYDPDTELPYSKETWDSIIALLSRPWFNRLWVVQEIHPGSHLQVGHDTIALTAFSEAQYCLYCKTEPLPGLKRRMLQVDAVLAAFWTMALPRILYRATFKQCADARDKIYGLLGLAPRKFAESIKVNYEDSNTAADVYKMTVLNHAKITDRLEHFHNCYLTKEGKRKIPEAPSWVPDWASGAPGETYIASQFVATTSRAHYRHSPENGSVLEVLGVRFGKVIHTTDALPRGLTDRFEAIKHVRKWQPEDLDKAKYAPTGEPLRKAYAITLICNGLREREPDWIVSTQDEWAKQDFDEALFGEHAKDTSGEASTAKLRQDTADALQCCADRTFFRTDDGYIGLGPAETQPNDIIAVLLGTPNAIILRPVADSDAQFSIIGETFVYGLHDAIPLLGAYPKPWSGVAAWGHGDRRFIRYVNSQTGEKTEEDPRLVQSKVWERIETRLERDDPTLYDFFQNKETKEIINYDPRLEPEELEKRGVKLNWFSLV